MKLMELLTREQQHLITESYSISGQDAVRLEIIHESYVRALSDYRHAVEEHTPNSRQAHAAKNKLEQYSKLYNDFVVEMDNYYDKK